MIPFAKKIVSNIFSPTYFKRTLFFLLSDILIIIASLYISFLLRFDFALSSEYKPMILRALPLFLIVKISMFALFKIYNITWQYVSIPDFLYITIAQSAAFFILAAVIWNPFISNNSIPIPIISSFLVFPVKGFPRSILFIDCIMSLSLVCGLRISKRVFLKYVCRRMFNTHGKNTLVIGAGNTGSMIIRDLKEGGFNGYRPVGLLDDDEKKTGKRMHGIPVLGTTEKLGGVIKENRIRVLIIAIPSLNYKTLRKLYSSAKEHNVEIKIIPRIYDHCEPAVNIRNLEDISVEDLLGRQAVKVDCKGIEQFIHNKRVLITGAGGSIGSEIAMQVCSFHPEKVILLDNDETELHHLKLKLEKRYPRLFQNQFINSQMPQKVLFITGDIRDEESVTKVFEYLKPQIVLHAAAYKHVPMMEFNAKEAVKVNMHGTNRVAKASADNGVEKFIFISTDKAVRPTSIMGATKQMAEHICVAFNKETTTEFLSVRFGNVLGSRGSVLPVFFQQLKAGGPLTVTREEVIRYFMTIPEAVSLVLQASILGKGGDILVLDMGEPVKLLTLAEDLIRIHGLRPYEDIDIKITDLRPGEKLYEEILTAEEGAMASRHEKVFFAKNSRQFSRQEVEYMLEEFTALFHSSLAIDHYEIFRDMLKKYVTDFERRRHRRTFQNDRKAILQVGNKRFAFTFLDKELQEEASKHFSFSYNAADQDCTFIVGYQDNARLYKDWDVLHFEQDRLYCKHTAKDERRFFFPRKDGNTAIKYLLICIYSEFYKGSASNEGKKKNDFFLRAGGITKNGKGFILLAESGDFYSAISKLPNREQDILSDELLVVTEEEGEYFISGFPVNTSVTKQINTLYRLNSVFLLTDGINNSPVRLTGKKLVLSLMNSICLSYFTNKVKTKDILDEKLRIISELGNNVPAYKMELPNDKSLCTNNFDLNAFISSHI